MYIIKSDFNSIILFNGEESKFQINGGFTIQDKLDFNIINRIDHQDLIIEVFKSIALYEVSVKDAIINNIKSMVKNASPNIKTAYDLEDCYVLYIENLVFFRIMTILMRKYHSIEMSDVWVHVDMEFKAMVSNCVFDVVSEKHVKFYRTPLSGIEHALNSLSLEQSAKSHVYLCDSIKNTFRALVEDTKTDAYVEEFDQMIRYAILKNRKDHAARLVVMAPELLGGE